MLEPIKLIVGPSPHYRQLKSGQIKYQKSRPANPIWRILVIDERNNNLHMRFLARQPSAENIDKIVMGWLSDETLLNSNIVIPKTVERLCPGLQEKFMARGATVYRPAHGFASGSLASKEAAKFLSYLEMFLSGFRESMASCEEISAVAGNLLGFVKTTLWRDDDKKGRKSNVAHKMAHDITRLRGRNPEVGREMRDSESVWGPLNKGNHVPPREDVLDSLLSNPSPLLQEPMLWDVISQLKMIRDAEPGQKFSLIQDLGTSVVLYQIASIRRGGYWTFLSNTGLYLRDKSLRYVVSLGMREAFKMLIVLDEGLLQASAARVDIHYPQDCTDLSLRGIPAHHQVKRMVQRQSGGKVAILPNIAISNPGIPEFLERWGPFNSPWFSGRTPFSPAQCLIPTTKAGSQKSEGLLIVLAILPKDTGAYVPIGDHELAAEMNAFINDRLTRNGKGVTCKIGPLQRYGDLMEIGDPPINLREVTDVDLRLVKSPTHENEP